MNLKYILLASLGAILPLLSIATHATTNNVPAPPASFILTCKGGSCSADRSLNGWELGPTRTTDGTYIATYCYAGKLGHCKYSGFVGAIYNTSAPGYGKITGYLYSVRTFVPSGSNNNIAIPIILSSLLLTAPNDAALQPTGTNWTTGLDGSKNCTAGPSPKSCPFKKAGSKK